MSWLQMLCVTWVRPRCGSQCSPGAVGQRWWGVVQDQVGADGGHVEAMKTAAPQFLRSRPPRPWLQAVWLAEVCCQGALQQAACEQCQEMGLCLFARQGQTRWVSCLLGCDFTSLEEAALESPWASSCSARAKVLQESLLFWWSYLWPFGTGKVTFAFWFGVHWDKYVQCCWWLYSRSLQQTGCSSDGCCGLFEVKSFWALWLREMQTVINWLDRNTCLNSSESLHPLRFK